MAESEGTKAGSAIGAALAIMLSMKLNGSLGWAIFHMFVGWIYVLYALLFRWNEVNAILFR